MKKILYDPEIKSFYFIFSFDWSIVIYIKNNFPVKKFDKKNKFWIVPASVNIINQFKELINLFDFETDQLSQSAIYNLEILQSESQEQDQYKNKNNVPDIKIDNLKSNLWGHQKRAIAYAKNKDAVLLDMGMGTGKTLTTIAMIENNPTINKILIVAPIVIMQVWQDEFEKHLKNTYNYFILLLNQKSLKQKIDKIDYLSYRKEEDFKFIVIVNYESVWREPLAQKIKDIKFDIAILDECHKIKSAGSQVSKFFHKLAKTCKFRLGLSGTPIPQGILDAYGIYRFLDDTIFGTSYNRFKNCYADYNNYHILLRYKNLDDFKQKFDSIRFHASREFLDLPEAMHQNYYFDLEGESKRIYNQLEKEFYAEVESGIITVDNALVKLLRLQQITSGFLPVFKDKNDYGLSGDNLHTQKIKIVQEIISNLPEDEPVVIFCRFTHDIHNLYNALSSCSILNGECNQLQDWQDGKSKILLAQIKTGREGISLIRASHCIYFSMGFSVGDYEQSLARIHRPGQKNTCFYHHIICKHSVDEKIYLALKEKQDIVKFILKG